MAANAATQGGPRVRIVDSAGGGSGSRGWHILRSQWSEFKTHKAQSESLQSSDPSYQGYASCPMEIQRPGSLNLSKDGFDRMYDKIMAHYAHETPRSAARSKIWQSAYHSNNDLRALLGDPWLHRRDTLTERAATPPVVIDPSMAFFPTDWSNCLSEETLAELVIDAYASDFVDAFLDGAISLVEVSNKWSAVQAQSGSLQQSMSEPSLKQPKANLKLRNSSAADKVLLQMGLVEPENTSTDGFPMHGLTKDTHDAWNSRNYHKCKPLEPFIKRIAKATESQRPQRIVLNKLIERPQRDVYEQKFAWPMAATNFPSSWERYSQRASSSRDGRRPADGRSEEAPVDEDANAPPKWLIRVGKDGKTRFPYSLVSHRAFLDSQSDPLLKAKASKIAPLRLSSNPF